MCILDFTSIHIHTFLYIALVVWITSHIHTHTPYGIVYIIDIFTPQSKKAHIEEIRSDAESLKKMKQQQKQQSKVFILCIIRLLRYIVIPIT